MTEMPSAVYVTFNISGVAMTTISGSDLMQRPHLHASGGKAVLRAADALNAAPQRRGGSGTTNLVTCDVEAAGVIEDYCVETGQLFITDPYPLTRRDGRALLQVADRISAVRAKAARLARPPAAPQPRDDTRRNFTRPPLLKHASAVPDSYAVVVGRGEPTRTPEDMRVAVAIQITEHCDRFPDPAGEVDAELAAETASLIVADHYQHPCTLALQRHHLLKYVAVVRARRSA